MRRSGTSDGPGGAPILRTERFVLRPMERGDRPWVFRALSDPRIVAHYGVRFDTLEATGEQMDWYDGLVRTGAGVWWAVLDAEPPHAPAGAIGFHGHDRMRREAEIGFWVLPERLRQGTVSSCLPVVVEHAFGPMGLTRVVAEVEQANLPSRKLLERFGFASRPARREVPAPDGRRVVVLDYVLERELGPVR